MKHARSEAGAEAAGAQAPRGEAEHAQVPKWQSTSWDEGGGAIGGAAFAFDVRAQTELLSGGAGCPRARLLQSLVRSLLPRECELALDVRVAEELALLGPSNRNEIAPAHWSSRASALNATVQCWGGCTVAACGT